MPLLDEAHKCHVLLTNFAEDERKSVVSVVSRTAHYPLKWEEMVEMVHSIVVVTSNEAGNSAIAAAPRLEPAGAGPSYAGPYVDRKAVQVSSKYDGKEDIESWISSMRAYFEILGTRPETQAVVMGINVEPVVRGFLEVQAMRAGCEVFSKIDLKSSYHQIEVDPADQHKTAFKTRDGLYEFTVMPFGLTNAPATFQSLMDKVLREQIGRLVVVYVDDIPIFSKSMEEHLKHLNEVLAILKKTQLHLNLEKSEFGKDNVIYLGHPLFAAGLELEATKIEVIRDWPQLANIRELRSFLGLASYYRKFAVRRRRMREGIHERQQRSESRHEAYLLRIAKRAGDESSKVSEVQFIASLSAENKKLSLQQKLEQSEVRRQKQLESIRQKQRGDMAKEEAAMKRREALEAERLQKIAEQQREDHPVNFYRRTVHIRDRNGVLVPCTVPPPHPLISCHVVSAASIRASITRDDIEGMGVCFLHALPPHDIPSTDASTDLRITKLLNAYGDIFEAPHGVVPDRPILHEIILEAGVVPLHGCIYRMSEEELSVLRAQLDDLLEKGRIRPCSSPYGAPVLFVRKKNKDLRLCIDYRKLNAQTIKNAGPLPSIDDLLERLGGAKFLSKLDLKSGYHQLEIRQEDGYKTAFKTRYGHFEWLVMPLALRMPRPHSSGYDNGVPTHAG
ncbi:hypothetical protein CBR_g23193 [Chara braunii]|uniref:Reverse transcriptase domain-containing protein n=1 Tax=Chara braunii TaxID=69332 RepID=A0A388JV81_CHABU|nr:hypothetical protein CBR_g23193 [Chara braunii]|eukprot:GBG61677.1 hypothetical protein CBR_g23193 [Chara braunii]